MPCSVQRDAGRARLPRWKPLRPPHVLDRVTGYEFMVSNRIKHADPAHPDPEGALPSRLRHACRPGHVRDSLFRLHEEHFREHQRAKTSCGQVRGVRKSALCTNAPFANRQTCNPTELAQRRPHRALCTGNPKQFCRITKQVFLCARHAWVRHVHCNVTCWLRTATLCRRRAVKSAMVTSSPSCRGLL